MFWECLATRFMHCISCVLMCSSMSSKPLFLRSTIQTRTQAPTTFWLMSTPEVAQLFPSALQIQAHHYV